MPQSTPGPASHRVAAAWMQVTFFREMTLQFQNLFSHQYFKELRPFSKIQIWVQSLVKELRRSHKHLERKKIQKITPGKTSRAPETDHKPEVAFRNRRLVLSSMGFPGGSGCQESACNKEDLGLIPGVGRFLEKGRATHSSILAWRIPWTEESSGLQSMGSQRVTYNWVLWSFGLSKCQSLCFYHFPSKR